MRMLLRILLRPLASVILFLPVILAIGYATWEKTLHPVIGVGLVLLDFVIFGQANQWLERDRVTLDPYKARRRLPKAQAKPTAPPPAGMAAIPVTRADLQLAAPKAADPFGPPEMISRLPAGLNRMVVEGLEMVAEENRR